jgi:hypothetical protein
MEVVYVQHYLQLKYIKMFLNHNKYKKLNKNLIQELKYHHNNMIKLCNKDKITTENYSVK